MFFGGQLRLLVSRTDRSEWTVEDRKGLSFSTFSAHQVGGTLPFVEKNEFEYMSHIACVLGAVLRLE